MNHEIEYHNHKNHLGGLRQETKTYKLAHSSKSSVKNTTVPLHKVVIGVLTSWLSQLRIEHSTKLETSLDYSSELQQETNS